jgi:hypothetical protein
VRPLRGPALLAAAALAGCATARPTAPVCPAGHDARAAAQLVFGRNIGEQPGVSDEDFRRFVDEEITPRFPDGLTVLDAAGQWRGPSGVLVHESSKVVLLILPTNGSADKPIAAIREAYKAKFRQDAVLFISQPACVSF